MAFVPSGYLSFQEAVTRLGERRYGSAWSPEDIHATSTAIAAYGVSVERPGVSRKIDDEAADRCSELFEIIRSGLFAGEIESYVINEVGALIAVPAERWGSDAFWLDASRGQKVDTSWRDHLYEETLRQRPTAGRILIDEKSLAKYGRAKIPTEAAKAGDEKRCREWLENLPVTPRLTKEAAFKTAKSMFPSVTWTGFKNRIWQTSAPEEWRKGGRIKEDQKKQPI